MAKSEEWVLGFLGFNRHGYQYIDTVLSAQEIADVEIEKPNKTTIL